MKRTLLLAILPISLLLAGCSGGEGNVDTAERVEGVVSVSASLAEGFTLTKGESRIVFGSGSQYVDVLESGFGSTERQEAGWFARSASNQVVSVVLEFALEEGAEAGEDSMFASCSIRWNNQDVLSSTTTQVDGDGKGRLVCEWKPSEDSLLFD